MNEEECKTLDTRLTQMCKEGTEKHIETTAAIATMASHIANLNEKISEHISRYNQYELEEAARQAVYLNSQQENTQAIQELVKAHEIIAEQHRASLEKSKDMQDAWDAAVGAIKVGGTLGRFLKWFIGIVAVITMCITYLKT